MHQNKVFLFFLKLFLILVYQNDLKILKKIILNKKNLKTRFASRFQTQP
jgi:hypothetical protein